MRMIGGARLRTIASPRGRRLSMKTISRPSRSRRKRRMRRPSSSVTVTISSPSGRTTTEKISSPRRSVRPCPNRNSRSFSS